VSNPFDKAERSHPQDGIDTLACSPHEGPDASQQFVKGEWLDEVIIRAAIETANAVGHGIPRGQYHHWGSDPTASIVPRINTLKTARSVSGMSFPLSLVVRVPEPGVPGPIALQLLQPPLAESLFPDPVVGGVVRDKWPGFAHVRRKPFRFLPALFLERVV